MQCLSRVDRTARQKLELQIFLLYLLGVCSRRHPVMTSGCLLRLPGDTTSSANANAVVHYHVLFKSAFHFGFLAAKAGFSLKSVPLNSYYTEAYQ